MQNLSPAADTPPSLASFLPAPGSRLSLGSWLTAMVLAVVAVSVLSSALLIENFTRAHAERRAIEGLRQVAVDFRDALDRGMAQQFKEVRVLAQLEPFQRFDDLPAMRRALDQVQVGFDHFAWLGVTDASGKVLAAAGGLLDGVDVSKRPWWQGAQKGPFVGDIHAAVLLEKLLPRQNDPWRFVDFAVPVLSSRGERQGVFGVHLSWSWARQIKAELIDATMSSHQADALVLGHDGTVILGPANLEGKKMAGLGEQGVGLRHHEADGTDYFAIGVRTEGYGAYPGLGWTVLVRQPVAVAMADYYTLRRQIILSAILLLTLGVPLSWWLARRMSAPLKELAQGIAERKHLADGQLPRVGGYLEAALLSNALADLSQRQAEQDASLAQLNASLEQRVEERTRELQEAMQRVVQTEKRLRGVTTSIPAMVGYFDTEQRCQFANDMALRVFGFVRMEQAVGLSMRAGMGEAAYALHEDAVRQVLVGKASHFIGELPSTRLGERAGVGDGGTAHFQAHLVPDFDADSRVQGFYLMSFDITRLKQAELAAAQSERRLRTIADNLPVLISYIDAEQRLRFLNATYKQWMGTALDEALGRPLAEAVGPVLYEQRRVALDRALAGERQRFETRSDTAGVQRDLLTDYIPDLRPDGTVAGIYTLATDITAFKQVERELDQLSRVDLLTGLPNRRQFESRLSESLARARRSGHTLALMFLDVDKFKTINDTLGHATGDAVLKAFAQRLRGCVRETDLVCRLAGDEFVLVLEGLNLPTEAGLVADKVLAAVGQPLDLPDRQLHMSTSIGIACWQGPSESDAALLARADQALYAAKEAGRGRWSLAE